MSLLDVVGGATFKLYAMLAAIAVIVGAVGGLYWYVNALQGKVETLQADNKILNSAVEMQKSAMAQIHKDLVLARAMQDELRKGVHKNFEDAQDLKKRFEVNAAGKPRDIGGIAVKEPVKVEKLVNKGVESANRCLELASGAPITEKEKNAKLKSEINSICPSLANPNYKPN